MQSLRLLACKSPAIVIFDSGVGGLSIYEHICQQLPHHTIIYCSDNAGFPYGSKSAQLVEERTSFYLQQLQRWVNPELFIIACNTASTIALDRVRAEVDVPVVGVVPAIKTAAMMSQKKVIGLLATPATIKRSYTDDLIDRFAGDCKVIRVGSVDLVTQAERKLRQQSLNTDHLVAAMDVFFKDSDIPDYIVLGCTHFPLIKEELCVASREKVHFVDSGRAIANRVSCLLKLKTCVPQANLALFTQVDNEIYSLYTYLSNHNFTQVGILAENQLQFFTDLHKAVS